MAHALGFGIYREKGIVKFFDDTVLWKDIGYTFVSGTMVGGKQVTIKRANSSYPQYFTELLKPDDAVQSYVFDTKELQAQWIAEQIKRNLAEDELDVSDILIILADPL